MGRKELIIFLFFYLIYYLIFFLYFKNNNGNFEDIYKVDEYYFQLSSILTWEPVFLILSQVIFLIDLFVKNKKFKNIHKDFDKKFLYFFRTVIYLFFNFFCNIKQHCKNKFIQILFKITEKGSEVNERFS